MKHSYLICVTLLSAFFNCVPARSQNDDEFRRIALESIGERETNSAVHILMMEWRTQDARVGPIKQAEVIQEAVPVAGFEEVVRRNNEYMRKMVERQMAKGRLLANRTIPQSSFHSPFEIWLSPDQCWVRKNGYIPQVDRIEKLVTWCSTFTEMNTLSYEKQNPRLIFISKMKDPEEHRSLMENCGLPPELGSILRLPKLSKLGHDDVITQTISNGVVHTDNIFSPSQIEFSRKIELQNGHFHKSIANFEKSQERFVCKSVAYNAYSPNDELMRGTLSNFEYQDVKGVPKFVPSLCEYETFVVVGGQKKREESRKYKVMGYEVADKIPTKLISPTQPDGIEVQTVTHE